MHSRRPMALAALSLVLALPCPCAPAQDAAPDESRFFGNAFTAFDLKPYENFRVVDTSGVNVYCTPNLPECRYLSGDRRNRPDTLVRVKNYARRTSETANALATRLPKDWQHLLLAPDDPAEGAALVRVTLRSWQGLPAVDALWMSPSKAAPAISRFVFYPSGFRQQFECGLSISDVNWRAAEFEQQCERGFGAIAFKQEFVPKAQAAASAQSVVHDACEAPEVVRARSEHAAVAGKMLAAAQAHLKALAIVYEIKPTTSEEGRRQVAARLMDAADDSIDEMRRAVLPARNLKPVPVLAGLDRSIAKAAQSLNHSVNMFTSIREGNYILESQTAAQAALDALAPARQDANRCPFP